MIKKIFSSSVLLLSIFLMPQFGGVSAEGVQKLADIGMRNTSLLLSGKQLGINFTIVNNDDMAMSGIRYGMLLQDDNGVNVYEDKSESTLVLNGQEEMNLNISSFYPSSLMGEYKVFGIVKNIKGLPLAMGYIGTVTLEGDINDAEDLRIKKCSVTSLQAMLFNCQITGSSSLMYTVYVSDIYGEVVAAGEVDVSEDGIIDLSNVQLDPRVYEVVFELKNEAGEIVSQAKVPLNILGSWISIKNISTDTHTDGSLEAAVYFTGNGTFIKSGFKYWILNDEKQVCGGGDIKITEELPVMKILFVPENDCVNPELYGFVYSGVGDVYKIEETVGDIDFSTLLNQAISLKVSGNIDDNILKIALVVLFIILMFVIWYFGFKEDRKSSIVGGGEKKKRGVLGVVFMLLFFAPAVSFGATYTLSNGDILTITLANNGVFRVDDGVTFTLGYTDSVGNARPAGTVLRARIDSESYQTIVDANTVGNGPWAISALTIPSGISGGTHTLTIERPGHIFDSTVFTFDNARFDVADSDTGSQITINIIVNVAPTPPQITGSCIVGDSIAYSFKSTDSDGDTLYYEVDWDANGSGIVRTPSSGYVTQNIWQQISNTWNSLGAKFIKARAIDVNAEPSTWATYSTTCTLGCSYCTPGQPSVTISAFPPFVRSGDTSTISWTLQGVLSCYIDSSNNADDWNWDTVRQTASHSTSAITENTTYTLYCKNESGNDIAPVSTSVTTAPKWQEN